LWGLLRRFAALNVEFCAHFKLEQMMLLHALLRSRLKLFWNKKGREKKRVLSWIILDDTVG
jgi:hypothetical protein